METSVENPKLRTWIFFYLIILTALLWATFLMTRGEMIGTSVALFIIATFMSSFSFTFARRARSWIYLYLITFAAVLWAAFLLVQGVMVVVSVFLISVAACVNIFSFIWIDEEQEETGKQDHPA
ncbi:MAG TPA: hypothetical protein VLY83_06815 [Methanoregula sp.]|nr:hypothetical protein [Methanoregula sp.]